MGANSSSSSSSAAAAAGSSGGGGASATPEGSYGVRVSHSLMESSGAPAAAAGGGGAASNLAPDEADALRQQAFQQGMEYAARQLSESHVATEATRQQHDLVALEASNEDKQRQLTATIDALHAREYRPPMQPMACAEERQGMLECYRAHRDAPAGELVVECDAAVRALDKCALYVRQAAMAKIAPGSLPGQQ
jgi:hypothetical protein